LKSNQTAINYKIKINFILLRASILNHVNTYRDYSVWYIFSHNFYFKLRSACDADYLCVHLFLLKAWSNHNKINAVLTDKLHFMFNKTQSCRTHVIMYECFLNGQTMSLATFHSFWQLKWYLSHNFNQISTFHLVNE
jgi:hypothetical protein